MVVWPRLGDLLVCENPPKVYVPYSPVQLLSCACTYHLFVWSNLNFLLNIQWITLSTQSGLVLYSFWAKSLHLLIIWLIVSSLSLHNLHLLFCCVLSILASNDSFLCAAIGRLPVSLLRFPFLSHIHVFYSRMMLFIRRLKRSCICFSSHFCFLVIIVLLVLVLNVLFLV